MFDTRITRLFGIEYPVIQGALQWLSGAELVSAVSNAGGLGILASLSFTTADELRKEIRRTKGLTDKPFAVNFTLLPTMRPVNYEEFMTVAIEEGVGIIETAGRSPEPYLRLLKDGKVKLMHKVARVKDARSAEKMGVDAVTIVGFEAGGHPGMDDIGSMVIIPRTVESVKIPVIAAGGISDARGFVAALALGAEGVLMGTRFMATKECLMHPAVKEWMLQAGESDTHMVERSIKNAARVMKTDYSQKVLSMEERGATLEELLPLLDGLRGRKALEEGDVNLGVLACGQGVSLIHDIPSVKELVEGIISGAREITQRLGAL